MRKARAALDPPGSPLWSRETKSGARELVATCNVPTPKLLHPPGPMERVPWHALPEQFVVKPDWGTASRGVYVFHRTGGTVAEVLTGVTVRADRLLEWLRGRHEKLDVPTNNVLVEDALTVPGRSAYDWKLWTFDGKVGAVTQAERIDGRKRFKYYDGNWHPLSRISPTMHITNDLPSPRMPERLMEVARELSRLIPTPFVRIDLYEKNQEVFFGEFTIVPGGTLIFAREVDRALGELWEEAAARLIRRNAPVLL